MARFKLRNQKRQRQATAIKVINILFYVLIVAIALTVFITGLVFIIHTLASQ